MTSYKGLTGSWTKWGGARQSLSSVNQYSDFVSDDWYCQSCGRKQPGLFSPFKVEFPKDEYISVCACCYFDHCLQLVQRQVNEAFAEMFDC